MTGTVAIGVKPDIRKKLKEFKKLEGLKSYSDAIKLLLDTRKITVKPKIRQKLREFCDYEHCESESEGIKKLLVRNIQHGYGPPDIKARVSDYFQEYNNSKVDS